MSKSSFTNNDNSKKAHQSNFKKIKGSSSAQAIKHLEDNDPAYIPKLVGNTPKYSSEYDDYE